MSFFLLSSLTSSSKVSVVFDFNDLLNDVAPLSPMLFSVDIKRMGKGELFVDSFCVSSLSSPLRSSTASVVFDFNDSLNDAVPLSPISFTVDVKRKEKSELLMDVFCVSSFFCLHNSDRVQ